MNDPLEHDVCTAVNISHLPCLELFASYFSGCAGVSKIILIKCRHFDVYYYFIKFNGFPHRMLCISNLALAGLWLAQFNIVDNMLINSNSAVS